MAKDGKNWSHSEKWLKMAKMTCTRKNGEKNENVFALVIIPKNGTNEFHVQKWLKMEKIGRACENG